MKNLLAVIVLFLNVTVAISQDSINFPNPKIWLRADQPGLVNTQWPDVSGHGYNAIVNNNMTLPDTTLFNFNPSFLFDTNSKSLSIDYCPRRSSKLLVFAVYRPYNSRPESGIWDLALDSNIKVRLTTQKLRNLYRVIQYDDSTGTFPTINLLNQNWRNKNIDTAFSKLIIAGTDSLSYTGKFAEFILYDTLLSQADIFKLHTYLAIKYGVSIAEMNYVQSNDSTIWDYQENILFKFDIAGLGKDSLIDVNQKQSAGNGGESPLKIAAGALYENNSSNPARINQGDFLIWGHTAGMLADIDTSSVDTTRISNLSKCVWLMKSTGLTHGSIRTQLILDASLIPGVDSINLVINRYGNSDFTRDSSLIIAPAGADSTGRYYFNDVLWDTDNSGSDVFTFQVMQSFPSTKATMSTNDSQDEDTQQPLGGENLNSGAGNAASGTGLYNSTSYVNCSLYPNPTAHEYSITIDMNTTLPLIVEICDENGKQIERFRREGALQYVLSGNIDKTGCYFVTVKTPQESKTYKLVVN